MRPAKSRAYVATTSAWLGDRAAVRRARQVLVRLEDSGDGRPRPRRTASARLDLALAPTAERARRARIRRPGSGIPQVLPAQPGSAGRARLTAQAAA
jgi:hypothetical protein